MLDSPNALSPASHLSLACGSLEATHTLVPPDGANNRHERVVNVDTLLCGRLNALGAETLGKVAALVRLDLALVLEVALVGNNHDREVVSVLDLGALAEPSAILRIETSHHNSREGSAGGTSTPPRTKNAT